MHSGRALVRAGAGRELPAAQGDRKQKRVKQQLQKMSVGVCDGSSAPCVCVCQNAAG